MAELTSVVLAGGGTAGHVNPLLAVADELRRRDPDLRVTVLGIPAPAQLRTPRALEYVGPRAFGYDMDFRPL